MKRFETLNLIDIPVFVTDDGGQIVFANQSWQRQFVTLSADDKCILWDLLLTEADRALVRDAYQMAPDLPAQFCFVLHDHSGAELVTRWSNQIDIESKRLWVSTLVAECTQPHTQHNTHETLVTYDAYLQALLNHDEQAYILLNTDRLILAFNERADHNTYEIMGLNLAINQPIMSYLSDDFYAPFDRNIRRALEGEKRREDLIIGERWFDIQYSPVMVADSDVKGVAITITEITRTRRTEQELWRELEINAVLNALHEPLIAFSEPEEMTSAVLTQARILTTSEHGFVSIIDPVTKENVAYTLTNMLNGQCQLEGPAQRIRFPIGASGQYSALWGHALNTRQSMYINENPHEHPASNGLIAGHIPIERFMAVPVMLGDELVGEIALANPDRPYNESDIEAIERIARILSLGIQRIRTSKHLEMSETRYRSLAQESVDGVMLTDEQGRIIEWNASMEQITQMPATEALGQTIWDIQFRLFPLAKSNLPCQDLAVESMKAFFKTGTAPWLDQTFSAALLRPDGSCVYVQQSLYRMDVYSGYLLGGMMRDVTASRTAEHALREAEKRYRMLSNLTFEGILLHRNGLALDMNRATYEMFGYTREELIGQDMIETLIPEEWRSVIRENVKRRYDRPYEVEGLRKDGSRFPVELEARPLQDGTRVAAIRDITERKALEQQHLELELERQRINLLAEFIQNSAHEFRTPLSSILLNLQMIRKVGNEQQFPRLERMEESIEEITNLLDIMLLMVRLDHAAALNLMWIDLRQLVHHVVNHMAAQAELKGQTLHAILPADHDELMLRGDEQKLSTALMEMLFNAMNYSPEGSEITVILQHVDDQIAVQVIDQGIGMDDQTQARIFERFYRADAAHTTRGFGLGLPIVRRIVDLHQGAISVSSAPDVGSTFTVTLPVPSDDEQSIHDDIIRMVPDGIEHLA